MTSRMIKIAAVTAAGLGFASAASAQVINSVANICEVVPGGGVNTVRLNLFSHGQVYLEYRFQKLPSGPVHAFPSVTPTSLSPVRKFAVPEGVYKLTYKAHNQPAVGTYNGNVVVKPYRVLGQTCVFLKPADKVEKPGAAQH